VLGFPEVFPGLSYQYFFYGQIITFFILSRKTLGVESGDILTLVGGLALVIIIAVAMNPHYLSGISPAPVTPVPTITPPVIPTVIQTPVPIETAISSPKPTPSPVRPDDPPYRIFYTNKPFTYPRFKLPDNMETFGASDIPLRNKELIPFAYIEDIRGGLTRNFSVPYPVWIINTTVIANRTPQYGNFRMALCYASNGSIIDGEEILNRGSSYRIIQTSNTDLYMIITTAYIDQYHISLETPRDYYNSYRPQEK
jgi:hypothetical protein